MLTFRDMQHIVAAAGLTGASAERAMRSMNNLSRSIATNIIENRGDLQMHEIKIERVIKNDDAVIVFWSDKTKTVVKLMTGDTDDIYAAVAQALAKKIYGGTGKFHSHVDKVLKDYTTPMISVKNSTISGFKNFFDGIWAITHPDETKQ